MTRINVEIEENQLQDLPQGFVKGLTFDLVSPVSIDGEIDEFAILLNFKMSNGDELVYYYSDDPRSSLKKETYLNINGNAIILEGFDLIPEARAAYKNYLIEKLIAK